MIIVQSSTKEQGDIHQMAQIAKEIHDNTGEFAVVVPSYATIYQDASLKDLVALQEAISSAILKQTQIENNKKKEGD